MSHFGNRKEKLKRVFTGKANGKRERKQDLQAEIEWHERGFYVDSGHWTSHPLFATRERHWLATEVEKIRFYGYLSRYISDKPYYRKARVLIAPSTLGMR